MSGERWRTGTKPGVDGKTIYRHSDDLPEHGVLIGVMFDGRDAATVVEAVNSQANLGRQSDAPSQPGSELERQRRVIANGAAELLEARAELDKVAKQLAEQLADACTELRAARAEVERQRAVVDAARALVRHHESDAAAEALVAAVDTLDGAT